MIMSGLTWLEVFSLMWLMRLMVLLSLFFLFRIETMKQIEGDAHSHPTMQSQYHRMFIAEYEGQRAGLIVLKFHGDQ